MGWRLAFTSYGGAAGPPGPPGPPGPGGGTGLVPLQNDSGGFIRPGQPVYISSAGKVRLARANAAGTTDVIAIYAGPLGLANNAIGLFAVDGALTLTTAQWDLVTGEVGGLVAGRQYWLSDTTAGMMIDGGAGNVNAPSASGSFDALLIEAMSPTVAKILLPVQPIGPLP